MALDSINTTTPTGGATQEPEALPKVDTSTASTSTGGADKLPAASTAEETLAAANKLHEDAVRKMQESGGKENPDGEKKPNTPDRLNYPT